MRDARRPRPTIGTRVSSLSSRARPWVLATLGRLDPIDVRLALDEDALLAEVEPLLTIGPDENWVASTEVAEDLRFLLKQNIV